MTTHQDIVYADGFVGDLTGLALQGGSATPIAADGAIPITTLLTVVENDGTAAVALTLADGEAGQLKFIKYDDGSETGDVEVTPNDFADGTTITLNADGEGILLVSDGAAWNAVPGYTATIS